MALEMYSKLFKICVVSIIKVCLNSLRTLHLLEQSLFLFFFIAKVIKCFYYFRPTLFHFFPFYRQRVLIHYTKSYVPFFKIWM